MRGFVSSSGSWLLLLAFAAAILDRSGKIYVVDDASDQLLEFPGNPNGAANEAPRGTLQPSALDGPSTTIAPVALAAH